MNFLIQLAGTYLIYALFVSVPVAAFIKLRNQSMITTFLLQFGTTLLFGYITVILLQTIFPTDRPFVALGLTPVIPHSPTPSFPSSHATYAAICAVFLWRFNEKWGLWGLVALVLIGTARVLAYVHYPLDVIVGACLGTILSLFVPYLFTRRSSRDISLSAGGRSRKPV